MDKWSIATMCIFVNKERNVFAILRTIRLPHFKGKQIDYFSMPDCSLFETILQNEKGFASKYKDLMENWERSY